MNRKRDYTASEREVEMEAVMQVIAGSEMALGLPRPPAGFERVGLFGVLVSVPAEWNLHFYRERRGSGMLAFADLEKTRLEVRWREAKRARDLHRATLGRLKKRLKGAEIESRAEGTFVVRHGKSAYVIGAIKQEDTPKHEDTKTPPATKDHEGRVGKNLLFELHFSECDGRTIDWVTGEFLKLQKLFGGRGERWWSAYGASSWAPAEARARRIEFVPGHARVKLVHRGGAILFGAMSMAEKLLSERGLKPWAIATLPWAARMKDVVWDDGGGEITFRGTRRRWFRRVSVAGRFFHDEAGNRIVWEVRERKG